MAAVLKVSEHGEYCGQIKRNQPEDDESGPSAFEVFRAADVVHFWEGYDLDSRLYEPRQKEVDQQHEHPREDN